MKKEATDRLEPRLPIWQKILSVRFAPLTARVYMTLDEDKTFVSVFFSIQSKKNKVCQSISLSNYSTDNNAGALDLFFEEVIKAFEKFLHDIAIEKIIKGRLSIKSEKRKLGTK